MSEISLEDLPPVPTRSREVLREQYAVVHAAKRLHAAIKDNAAARRGQEEYGEAVITAEENLVEAVERLIALEREGK